MVGDVEFLQAEQKTGKVPRGWAAAQVATSADFAHESWFWTHFSGGLNYQARNSGPIRQPRVLLLPQFVLVVGFYACRRCNSERRLTYLEEADMTVGQAWLG